MSSIPAKLFVDVVPAVLAAGGNALALNGICVTQSTRPPTGTVPFFSSPDAVGSYFGGASNEKAQADVYFKGFTNATKRPGSMGFAQYPSTAVPAYIRGGNVSGLTLANLQALNGNLTATFGGVVGVGAVNLSAASSFSNAAEIIETALNLGAAFTASIDPNEVTGHIDPNSGTASIAGNTMTVSAVASGGYAPGQTISGTGVANGTTIVSQLTGTAGSTGTYQVSISQTVASTTVTSSGATLTVSAVLSGTLAVGQTLSGSGVTTGTKIAKLLTGTGGTGKYAVDVSQTVGSETITASGGTLDVTAVSSGTLGVGQVLLGSGVTAGNKITALLTGAGGTGTYLVSDDDTVVSESITVSGLGVDGTYDSVSGGFKLASSTSGAASTVDFCSGAIATSLKLTSATGAVLSQGTDAASPATFMDGIVAVTRNWASFFLNFDPDVTGHANKLAFSEWVNGTDDRYVFVGWDTDAAPAAAVPAASSWGYDLQQDNLSGTNLNWEPSEQYLAAFVSGTIASIDFTRKNGRITFAYRGQTGLVAGVTTETAAVNLGGNPQVTGSVGNGYNYYGAIATANDNFVNYQRGTVSGPWKWLDSYINQIWLNNALQLAILRFMIQINSFPYNAQGYALLAAACQDPINAALNFGAIRTGVPLSEAQIAAVNDAAGVKIDTILATQGYYLQILPASAEVRAARGSPPATLWYMDGGSVQALTLASIAIE